jgi:hypothetical protein
MNAYILAEKFNNFSSNECRGSSDLYEFLSLKIAEDEELLNLAANAREGQPVPNLFLGAVHYLLLQGKDHRLIDYFPSITENPKPYERSFLYFKDFCHQYKNEIISILQTKLVQTNEVRRCSYLYPTFGYIYEQIKKPLALVEIGTSAGLQLFWDKYSYSYGTNEDVYGEKDSEVHITSEIKGNITPTFPKSSPPVATRIGLDLHVNDLSIDENYFWLNALIWPEHADRRELFKKAANYVRKNSLTLIEGDGVQLLPELVSQISKDYAVCVFHTHVANQMPKETKEKLFAEIEELGKGRDIFHIYNNMKDRDLHLDYYIDGKEHCKVVGQTDGHGRWFTWEM